MKRGKDDEKAMEPMFPRLHVNDKERGGPRAPPRNKMALYEQFTIPSQRLNSGVFPVKPNRTSSGVSPASLSQEGGHQKGAFSQPHLNLSTHPVEESYAGYSSFNSRLTQLEQKKKLDDEDLTVPIFDQSEIGQNHSKSSMDSVYREDETGGSLPIGDGDRGDEASETSVVDSISVFDISPDDVVGVIGQKHFWKARRAIVNQQRVFAVQVFELHRLIKVQRSIAGSPHLFPKDGAYLGKKGSAAKKRPLEYIIKPPPHFAKHKDDFDNPNHKRECSAENAVQNVSHPSNFRPFPAHPFSTPITTDTKMSPWSFHQPPGHQWLIPVMSPSEGLIYKPYHPGHGVTGPHCGGCGFPGSNPMMGNFVNPSFDVPSYHHHQGIGVPPPAAAAPPFCHGYFPPYGMPFISPVNSGSAVEQASHFDGPGSRGGGQPVQHQSSPTDTHGAISNVVKPRATKSSEFQGSSTSSSPRERSNGRNALPTSPTGRPTRVIRVVPHNSVSATESVARIFQSIQEGRKQYDSV